MPAERLPQLVNVLLDLAESNATKPRERIAAIKALLSASKLNLEALRASMVAGEYEALTGRLAALGAVPSASAGASGFGGGGEGVGDATG